MKLVINRTKDTVTLTPLKNQDFPIKIITIPQKSGYSVWASINEGLGWVKNVKTKREAETLVAKTVCNLVKIYFDNFKLEEPALKSKKSALKG